MITDKLNFKQDKHYPHEMFNQSPKFLSSYDSNGYTLSVVYGGGSYGAGPRSDQYEIALFDKDDNMVQLNEWDTVAGWVDSDTINNIVDELNKDVVLEENIIKLVKERK